MKIGKIGPMASLSPIGLDIGARTIKAVQIRRRGEGLRIVGAVEFARSTGGAFPDAEEVERIEGVLHRRGFSGSRVTIAVPRGEAMFEEIERPPRGQGVPVDQIVRAEVARVRRVDPDTIEQAWWDIPSDARRGSAATAMVVATERAPLCAAIDQFAGAGLEVVGIESSMTGLASAVSMAGTASDGFTVIVDIGWGATALGVVYRDALVYQRSCESCGVRAVASGVSSLAHADAGVAEEMLREAGTGVAGAHAGVRRGLEELARGVVSEIELSLSYASHRFRHAPSGVIALCGGGAAFGTIGEHAGAIPSCTAALVRPSSFTIQGGSSIQELSLDTPSLTLACALAARFDQ